MSCLRLFSSLQNRVDLIFEITEGPVTGVKRINIIGNSEFPDRRLRKEIVTAESIWYKFFLLR